MLLVSGMSDGYFELIPAFYMHTFPSISRAPYFLYQCPINDEVYDIISKTCAC